MREFYLAYGMLTHPDIMPEAADYYGRATLNGYELKMLMYATIVPSAGSMEGVLWEIDQQTLNELDRVEGYPVLYGRKKVPVIFDGVTESAWVYYMTDSSLERLANRKPAKYYVEAVIEGYEMAGISRTQVFQAMKPTGEVT